MPSRQGVTVSNNLKQSPIPVVPSTLQLVNSDGTVTRSGKLLLQQLQPATTIQGSHANRPDPKQTPDGALYVESDRGSLYYNEGGTWQYLAGTMWGTLSPDQRPTDLGVNDAGFEFRSIDTNPDLAPRTFIWSQSEWIETTLVMYGTHANRPAPNETTPPRTIYVEEDRGNVMYQQQANKWMYIAGTMWGTLSPDQRPTDLGVNDAGFEFRSTDASAANAPRTFVWSQTAWIETTLVLYGAHAARPAANAQTPPRTLYIETDRGNVIYQQQGNVWQYVAGIMSGTISPDQRPTGLGVNDTEFQFRGTDQPKLYYWSGTAWVDVTPVTPIALLATATASLALTATPTNIPGCTLTLPNAGRYLVQGVFYFTFAAADSGGTLIGLFPPVGTASVAAMGAGTAITFNGTVTQQWLYTATAGAVITIQAYKGGGTGTASSVNAGHTSLSAIWLGP